MQKSSKKICICFIFLGSIVAFAIGVFLLARFRSGSKTVRVYPPQRTQRYQRLPQDISAETGVPFGKPSDPDALQRLTKRINRNGDFDNPNTPRPLVTLEEFFEGNNDYGSIGYNFYPDQPAPPEFYEFFKTIRDRPHVADVRVEVKDLEDPEGWPSTDTIWIITSASPDNVKNWLGQRFQADDIFVGLHADDYYKSEPYDIPNGMQAIGVWWD